MIVWLLRRLLQSLFVLIAMTAIVFIGINMIGNPVDIMISPDATPADRARAIAEYGLDKPLWEQYFSFIVNAVQGDVGRSYVFAQPALQLIAQRMPATIELALCALVLSIVIGIPLGLIAGLKPNSIGAKTIMGVSMLGFSLPGFWKSLMLILLFSVTLRWLPSIGRGETVEVFGIGWSFLTFDGLKHLILPAVSLSLFQIALVIRLTRAGVTDTMPLDFIKFARAKGLKPSRIISVHVLKNILIPVVTVVGLGLGNTIAFAVVTETIFAWPGMGKLLIDSINVLDRPVIVGYLMIIVLVFVIINLMVDLLYTALDPRVRLEDVE